MSYLTINGARRPPGRMPVVLLVDFQQRYRSLFTYDHGPLAEGISKAVSVIESARALSFPLILVSGMAFREVFPEIACAAGSSAIMLYKGTMNAFDKPDLDTMLNAYDADTLIVGGWVRHQCVMATVAEAIKRGFSVMTSDQILFGIRETLYRQSRIMSLDFFARRCNLFDTSQELIWAMGQIRDSKMQSGY